MCNFALALLLPCAASAGSFLDQRFAGALVSSSKSEEAFASFVKQHGRDYAPGSAEWQERQDAFMQMLVRVEVHNRRPQKLWTANITRFADRSAAERKRMLGYRRGAPAGPNVPGALGLDSIDMFAESLPASVDYKHLPAMQDVQDQQSCGSCWAFATTTALRGAYNKATGKDRTFSPQQLVSCTPNPRSCGGTGGCDGATVELAMEYITKAGIHTLEDVEYTAMDMACPKGMQMHTGGGSGIGRSDFGLTGWRTLPSNRGKPLMQALARDGPVAISVAADYDWFMYADGIVDTCDNSDPIVNHAVVLVGYGKEDTVGYWAVQNSWGLSWGEAGFIRIQRLGDGKDGDDRYCGWDTKPEDGIACKDDNATQVYVCGMCGILYDSVSMSFGSHSSTV